MFGRDRPTLAQLLPGTNGPTAAPTNTDWLDVALDMLTALRRLHEPMRGTLRAQPGGKQWCNGCGGTVRWPCVTRRILDGEPPSIAPELETTGSPLHLDEEAAG